AVPTLFRQLALAEFAAAARRGFDRYPECVLLPGMNGSLAEGEVERDEFAARTIFAFTVMHGGRLLSLAQSRALHQALNQDTAAPGRASTVCHIGQPVAIADGQGGVAGALRISADARLVSDSWVGAGDLVSTGRLTQRIDQIGTVLDKLRFLLS